MSRANVNYPGKVVGDYTVREFSHVDEKSGLRNWVCDCVCGESMILDTQGLNGKGNCRCANGAKNLKGMEFGRLTVLNYSEKSRPGRVYWDCECSCGNKRTVRSDGLLGGTTQSCGCLQKERASESSYRHGKAESKVYSVWEGMINRTEKKANARYKNYGGRGITVSDEWKDFVNFYADMGNPPTNKHEIDRIDNDGNYEKGNCRWVLPIQNTQNKGARTTTTSKYKGVYYDKARGKWVARLNKDGKNVFFKRLDSEIEAAKAYNEQAKKYNGEFAYLNKIE